MIFQTEEQKKEAVISNLNDLIKKVRKCKRIEEMGYERFEQDGVNGNYETIQYDLVLIYREEEDEV